jgi:TetR/AcrR family transcriptional regulator, cholesterol catabolism regulator
MRNQESPEKRKAILAAALKLFSATHNIRKVSLEDIAAEARVSPTTVYNHFHDRDTLVFEVVKELAQSNIARNRAVIRSNIPFAQKLMAVVGGKMDLTEQVNSEIIEKMLGQDKAVGAYVDEIFEKDIKPLWLEMLADGKKQGYIDPALDDDAMLMYLDIMEAGLKAKMEFFKDIKNNIKLIQDLTNMMFYGFLIKKIDFFGKGDR